MRFCSWKHFHISFEPFFFLVSLFNISFTWQSILWTWNLQIMPFIFIFVLGEEEDLTSMLYEYNAPKKEVFILWSSIREDMTESFSDNKSNSGFLVDVIVTDAHSQQEEGRGRWVLLDILIWNSGRMFPLHSQLVVGRKSPSSWAWFAETRMGSSCKNSSLWLILFELPLKSKNQRHSIWKSLPSSIILDSLML